MLICELQRETHGDRRGLAERIARRHLEREGYELFCGRQLLGPELSVRYHRYAAVQRRYDRLEWILLERLGLRLWLLREELGTGRGLPDYLCVHERGVRRRLLLVEVKLEHEQLKLHQLACIRLLERYGFETMLMRIKRRVYRVRAHADVHGRGVIGYNEREVLEIQERLWKRYASPGAQVRV